MPAACLPVFAVFQSVQISAQIVRGEALNFYGTSGLFSAENWFAGASRSLSKNAAYFFPN